MRKYLVILLAIGAWLLSSCGEGIKKRPLANSSREVAMTAEPVTNSGRDMMDRNGIKFWDDMDFDTYPTPTMSGKKFVKGLNPNASVANGRMHAAYRLGCAMAADDNISVSQREKLVRLTVPQVMAEDSALLAAQNPEKVFARCIHQAREEGERGMAALMMSGYYMGHMRLALECLNPDTHLPDDRVIAKAIANLDKLKAFLNKALSSEKELAVAAVIQKIVLHTDKLKNTYNNANAEPSDKYSELLGQVRDIDSFFN